MAFKPITNRVPITLYTLLGLLVLASIVFTVVWLIVAADWSVLWAPTFAVGVYCAGAGLMSLMFGIGAATICAFTVACLVAQALRLRAIAENPTATELAQAQPEPMLALPPGETLRVAWGAAPGIVVRRVVRAGVIVPVLGAFGATVVFALLPDFRFSALNPLNVIFPLPAGLGVTTPNAFDWLALSGPFFWLAGLSAVQLAQARPARRYAVIADERGVTIERGLRRRSLAWSDITTFVRLGRQGTAPTGGADYTDYMLGARTQSFLISIARTTTVQRDRNDQQTAMRVAAAHATLRYEGGVAGYTPSVQRLFATITARGQTPLCIARERAPQPRWWRWRFPERLPHISDTRNAPLAAAPWQPEANSVAMLSAGGERLNLQTGVGFWRGARSLTLWLVGLLALTALAFGAAHMVAPPLNLFGSSLIIHGQTLNPTLITDIVVGGGFYMLLSPVAMIGALSAQRSRNLTVLANDMGVTHKTPGAPSAMTVRWANIRAWGVLRPTESGRANVGATFVLFTESGRFSWHEPTGARLAGGRMVGGGRVAYCEQAARLHALIAARTGLPLCDLTQAKVQ